MEQINKILAHLPKQERDKLISALYETVLYPEKYDELINAWQDYLQRISNNQPDDIVHKLLETDNSLNHHFTHVIPMLEQTLITQQTTEKPSIDNSQIAKIRISKHSDIISINNAALAMFKKQLSFNELLNSIDSDSVERFKETIGLLANEETPNHQSFFTITAADNKTIHFVAKQMLDDNGEAELLLQSLEILWSKPLSDDLAEAYKLSPAEIIVAKEIAAGCSLAEIAAKLYRSIFTIRTHTNSILKKTRSATQIDLVRLISLMSQVIGTGIIKSANLISSPAEMQKLTLPDGRKMEIYSYGPSDGIVAIYLHHIFDRGEILKQSQKLLKKLGIRIICPTRVNFGLSGPDSSIENALNVFGSDLSFMVQKLGLKGAILVGYISGSFNAFAAAKYAPNLYSGIINVSGNVPIISRSQLDSMAPRQRTLCYIARYAPSLLPPFIRAGINQINTGSVVTFMEAFYKNGTYDRQVIEEFGLQDMIVKDYKSSVKQGSNSFVTDVYHLTRNWSYLAEDTSMPICLIHGIHDPFVSIKSARDFAKRYENIQLTELKDAGQLIFKQKPEYVLTQIRDFHLSNK